MKSGENSLGRPNEAVREIYLAPLEMIEIAEVAKVCIDEALARDWAVVSDRSYFSGIRHYNFRRSPDFRLALQDSGFSSLDIDLPRKDEDLRIRITAYAEDIPGRRVEFEEFGLGEKNGLTGFFVNDSHSLAFARGGGRPVDGFISQSEVASWLYLQDGLDMKQTARHLKSEADPVRHACDVLSRRAEEHFVVRQLKVPFSDNLELHGQLVEALDTDNPLAEPTARKYAAWINSHHDIDGVPLTERLFIEFSPDDILLGSDFSEHTRASVRLETNHPEYEIGKAVIRQALNYEKGNIADAFNLVRDRMGRTAA